MHTHRWAQKFRRGGLLENVAVALQQDPPNTLIEEHISALSLGILRQGNSQFFNLQRSAVRKLIALLVSIIQREICKTCL